MPLKRVRAATLLCFVSSSAVAAEPTKRECVDAATRGQDLREAGKLVDAREAFGACVASACPAIVKKSCGDWLIDVNARLPKIAVRVIDDAGHDLVDAKATIDDAGTTLGTSIPVDPGVHTIRSGTVSERITIAERETRTVVLTIASTPPPTRTPPPTPLVAVVKAAPQDQHHASVPTATWALAGGALVGIGVFIGFGASARDDLAELRAACAPDCAAASRDQAHTKAVVADVFLAAGIVSAAIGVVLFALDHGN